MTLAHSARLASRSKIAFHKTNAVSRQLEIETYTLDVLPDSDYPTVLKLSQYEGPPDFEGDFAMGLRALLDGLPG